MKVLDEIPIVYTTKLDDMDIFKRSYADLDYSLNDITNCILRESKPVLKKKSIHSSHTDQTSYGRVVKRLQVFNEKSRCKIAKCDNGYFSFSQENQINNESNNLIEQQHTSNNNGYNLIVNNTTQNLKSVIETTIDELFNDIPVHTITSDTENQTSTPVIEIKSDEDDDVQILNYDLVHSKPTRLVIGNCSNQLIKKRKKKSYTNTTVTIDSTDSDEEVPLTMIKYKKQKTENIERCKPLSILVEDIGLRRRQLRIKPFKGAGFLYCNKWYKINEISTALKLMIRNVYIFFHNKFTQMIDIYIIEDGYMTKYEKVNFNKSSVILKNSFDLTNTVEIECYCWYERVQANLKALESGLLSTDDIMFMNIPHSCEHNRCVCCCSTQNSKEKETTAKNDNNISLDNLEIITSEGEISHEISTICNNDNNCSVLRHNDWKHSLKTENNTPSLINECLSYNRDIDDKNVCYKYPNSINSKKYTTNNNNKVKKLLQPKSFTQYILNRQETSSQRENNVNVEPLKSRSFITSKLLLKPERAITTVAQFETKTGNPNEFDIPAKSVQPLNNTKRAVLLPEQSATKKVEISSVNAQSASHAEIHKVTNIAELIDSCIHKYIGASFTKTSEPCAGNATEIQQNKEFVSLETNRSNATGSGNTSCDNYEINVDSFIINTLKKFQGVRVTVNEDRKVSVSLGTPLNTLSLYELKVVANIILKAQQKVDALDLLPGTFLTNLSYIDNTLGKNNFLSSSHQVTSHHQISLAQQKINELVDLPKNNLENLHSTDNDTLSQITENHQSSNDSPTIVNEAISSCPKETNMSNNVDGNFGNVYKKFSMILKIKNDSYKKSFLEVNPLRISDVYSLADPATDSSSNKADTSKSNKNRNNASKLLSNNRQADSRRQSVKVTDIISAQRNTGKNKLNVVDQSPTENSSKQSFISPNDEVANYEIILNNLAEPQRTPLADVEEIDKAKQVDKVPNLHAVLTGNETVGLFVTPQISDDAAGGMVHNSLKKSCYNNTNSQLKAQLNAKLKLPPIRFYEDLINKVGEETDPLADTSELLKLNTLKEKCSKKRRNKNSWKQITLEDLDSDSNVGADLVLNEEVDVKEEIQEIDFVSCDDWAIIHKEEETLSKVNSNANFNDVNDNQDIFEEIEGEEQNILGV